MDRQLRSQRFLDARDRSISVAPGQDSLQLQDWTFCSQRDATTHNSGISRNRNTFSLPQALHQTKFAILRGIQYFRPGMLFV